MAHTIHSGIFVFCQTNCFKSKFSLLLPAMASDIRYVASKSS